MSLECLLKLHVLETVFTDPELRLFAVVLGEWREIPRIDLIATNLYSVNVLHFGDLDERDKKNTEYNILTVVEVF